MARFCVYSVKKRGSCCDPHERIEGLGGQDPKAWYVPENDMIFWIESRTHTFFRMIDGRPVEVVVAHHDGRKYLKTDADEYAPEHLLNLPECS